MAALPVRRVDAPKPRAQGVRRTPTPSTGSPALSLVPRPRVAVNAAILLTTVVVVLMLFAVVLHTTDRRTATGDRPPRGARHRVA